jgi:hypothetical protein
LTNPPSQPLFAHWVYPSGRLPLHQPAPGNCLIAAMATIGRAGMSTTGGRTNEGPFRIRKNSKHPGLVESPKQTEDGGCLPFLTHAPRDGWGFGRVETLKGKLEQKWGDQLTQKRDSEGWLRWLLREDSMTNGLNSAYTPTPNF